MRRENFLFNRKENGSMYFYKLGQNSKVLRHFLVELSCQPDVRKYGFAKIVIKVSILDIFEGTRNFAIYLYSAILIPYINSAADSQQDLCVVSVDFACLSASRVGFSPI